MKKAVQVLFLIAALMLVALPSFAQDNKNTLIMARATDATGLDPHTQTAFASFRLLELIYEPLVELDANLNVIPALAESWTFSDDGLTLTFNLRHGVKFHDGAEMTSADVIASFTRLLNPDTKAAAASNYASISKMDAPDAYTVVFTLSQSDVPMLTALTSTNAAIVPAAMAESGDFTSTADGTGPFKLTSWTPDQTTELATNTDWWNGKPGVDGIEIRIIPDETSIVAALRAGTIDFAQLNDPLAAAQLEGDTTVQLNKVQSLSYHVLQLNAANAPLDKLEVRQAMSCAIDRQEVLDTAALGNGNVTGPLTQPAYDGTASSLFCATRDLDKAKQLMADAGMSDGFTLKMIAANSEPPTAISEAQNIQAQLADININVEIESLELNVYVQRWLDADFDSAIALNSSSPDPYTTYNRYWLKDGRFAKTAGYGDDTLQSLMEQGRAETDPAKRMDIFTQLQQHLAEASPWIWLYKAYDYTAQQPFVSGFVPYPTDSLISLAKVTLTRPAQ